MPVPPPPDPSTEGGPPPLPGGRRDELLRRLRAALSERYDLEGELDHGGMGTVFLARDLRHGRRIALKVLHPELTHALGIERFLREIRTAGRLSHPHILPLHDSGEADGLLFYTMPFVEGESLRARLRREGRLPVAEALRIAEEIADALDYAHGEGILHRDIKPENILLSQGSHAVLADFGLARAVHTAANRRITPTGIALGSPLYMSPEQAAGVKEVDARSDVYSVGCVLHEMLAGEPPFTGPTPGAVIRRKIVGAPPPLRRIRAETPSAVERVVLRAMERLPERRFATAGELLAGIRGARSPRRWPAWRGAAAGAGGLLLVLLLAYLGVRFYRSTTLVGAGTLDPSQPILLADFQAPPADSLLANAVTQALRIDLAESRLISLVDHARIRAALQRMERPDTSRLDPGLARELAVREGIGAVVTGSVAPAGRGYLLTAQIVAPDSEAILTAARESARDSADLIPAIDRLSEELRRRIGESIRAVSGGEPLARVTTGSLRALERYTQAVRAIDIHGDYRMGIPLLEEAIALDPDFAMAYRKLGTALGNEGSEPERAIEMLRSAFERREHLPERERYLAAGDYYDAIGEKERAITAYQTLLDEYPGEYVALNNLAHLYSTMDDYRRAVEYYARAVESDPSSALALSNLSDAHFNAGEEALAEERLRLLRQRFPAHPNGAWYSSLFAAARGDYAAAAAEAAALREAQRDDAGWQIATTWLLGSVAATQGRLAEAERLLEGAARDELEHSTPAEYLSSQIAIAELEVRVRGDSLGAVERVERALRERPLEGIPFYDRPYTGLTRLYAAAGRPDRARTLLAEMEAGARPPLERLIERDGRPIRAAIALSEGEAEEAVRQLRGIGPQGCPICGLPMLAEAYERLGLADSAIAVSERFLATPDAHRIYQDRTWLGLVHERLAGLYERQGQPAAAAEHYRALVELWRGADAELLPRVREAERKQRNLGGG